MRFIGWAALMFAAQMLRIMTQAILSPFAAFKRETCRLITDAGSMTPTTRRIEDRGTTWTLKPANLMCSGAEIRSE